ncbi:MAG: hypothetical protein BroJett030_26110 [Alphaproteobacteria bacterium]|nr:MAG: hypothetical protein BroJett030_26110 [Alphaproteobacteria bacterium]
MTGRVPTSDLLERLLGEAPADVVSLGWLVERLGPRSFGLVLLLLGLLALLPAINIAAGLLLVIPATQMIRGRPTPRFPDRIAARGLPTRRLAILIRRALPTLRLMERIMRPRWSATSRRARRLTGTLVLLLAGVLLATPLPFSNVPPALAVNLIALAELEEDGVVLGMALGSTLVAIGAVAAAVWFTLR